MHCVRHSDGVGVHTVELRHEHGPGVLHVGVRTAGGVDTPSSHLSHHGQARSNIRFSW